MVANYKSLYYEDVKPGQEIPPFSMPITFTRLVMADSAIRDWNPQHHDRDYVQKEANVRDVFLSTSFYMAMITRFITDWAGPEALIRVLEFNMRTPICPGDDMTIEGKISGQRSGDGQHMIDLDIKVKNQLGPGTEATATIDLPSKTQPQVT